MPDADGGIAGDLALMHRPFEQDAECRMHLAPATFAGTVVAGFETVNAELAGFIH